MISIGRSLIAISLLSVFSLSCQEEDSAGENKADLCLSQRANDCAVLNQGISDNEASLREHLEAADFPQATKSALEMDHRQSLRELYRIGLDNESISFKEELIRYDDMIALTASVDEAAADFAFECSDIASCEAHALRYEQLAKRYLNTVNKKSSSAVKNLIEMNKEKRHLNVSLQGESEDTFILDKAYATLQGIVAELERYKLGESMPQFLSPSASMCSAEKRIRCDEIELLISQYRQMKNDSFASGEWELVNYASLMISYHRDILSAIVAGESEDGDNIAKLNQRIEDLKKIGNYGLPSYSPEEQVEVDKVTDLYGQLSIGLSEVAEDGRVQWSTAELSGRKPWSGYWYPFRYRDMFEGREFGSDRKSVV